MITYSATPIAPPGIPILAHDLPAQRKSWAPHVSEGFYLVPVLNHYRFFRIWNLRTQSERICETMKWLPHGTISVPTPTPDELLRLTITDLQTAIKNARPQQLPHLSPSGIRLLQHVKEDF